LDFFLDLVMCIPTIREIFDPIKFFIKKKRQPKKQCTFKKFNEIAPHLTVPRHKCK
jgi:hypothetical protein